MLRVLFALALLAVAEITLLVRIGEAFGGLAVLGLLVGSAVLGYFAARAQGLAVLRRWREAAATGEAPEEGLTDGLLVLLGGVLLALPGVISDVVGLLLFIPPVRRRVAARVRQRATTWISSGSVQVGRMRVVDLGAEPPEPPDHEAATPAFDPRDEPHREVIETEGYAVEERAELLLGPASPDAPPPSQKETP